MVGIPAWDGKADVVFGGRPSCSSLCPMGCCMRTRDMLGGATEWLQRRTFDDQIAACFCNVRINDGDIRIENEKAMYIYVLT